MVDLWKRYGQKLRTIILLHFTLVTPRFAYGRDQKPSHFHDFGFLDVSTTPKTNYFIFGDTRILKNKIKKLTESLLQNVMFVSLEMLETYSFPKLWERRAPNNPEDPS